MTSAHRERPTLAVIGGGIAGMGAALALQDEFDITLFERENAPGGHIRPVRVTAGNGEDYDVDTGFLAYQSTSYPRVDELIRSLGVELLPVRADATVWEPQRALGHRLSSFLSLCGSRFAPQAARDVRGLVMLMQTFDQIALELDETLPTLDAYLAREKIHSDVRDALVIPAIAATWGFQAEEIGSMAAGAALREMMRTAPPTHRLVGGTRRYLQALTDRLGKVRLICGSVAADLLVGEDGVRLFAAGCGWRFDYVVTATHADEALRLLREPSAQQRQILGEIGYRQSVSIVHSDRKLLPTDAALRSEVYVTKFDSDGRAESIVTWDFGGKLVDALRPVVSVGSEILLDRERIDARQIHHVLHNTHPALTPESLRAQRRLGELNTGPRLFFCGSYFGYTGSHECAYQSALAAAQQVRRAAFGRDLSQ